MKEKHLTKSVIHDKTSQQILYHELQGSLDIQGDYWYICINIYHIHY